MSEEVQDSKTPRERFEELAPKRTETALKAVRVLSRCGNRQSYEYTEEEAAQIFDALEAEVKAARECFKPKEAPQKFGFKKAAA